MRQISTLECSCGELMEWVAAKQVLQENPQYNDYIRCDLCTKQFKDLSQWIYHCPTGFQKHQFGHGFCTDCAIKKIKPNIQKQERRERARKRAQSNTQREEKQDEQDIQNENQLSLSTNNHNSNRKRNAITQRQSRAPIKNRRFGKRVISVSIEATESEDDDESSFTSIVIDEKRRRNTTVFTGGGNNSNEAPAKKRRTSAPVHRNC